MTAAPERPVDPILALIRAAVAGDRVAEDRLTRQLLLPMVDAAVSKHLFGNAKRRYDKEELVQEILAHLCDRRWARLQLYDPDKGELPPYIWKVVEHWIISNIVRKRPPPEPDEDTETIVDPRIGPEKETQFIETMEQICEALNVGEILLFRWVHLEGMKPKEVAARLQISIDATNKRIQRMTAKVQIILL